MARPSPFSRLLQIAFFALVVRPLVLLVLGLRIDGRERLPAAGPAVLIANHNSHLDTLVLMSIYPLATLARIRPVSAADYFLKTPLKRWFSTTIIRIIPMTRPSVAKAQAKAQAKDQRGAGTDPKASPFDPVYAAIEAGDIVIYYPEGSRGEPERLAELRHGIARIAQRYPDLAIVPIFMHGLGKALPKGDRVLVPFFCDIVIGEPMTGAGRDRAAFMDAVEHEMEALTQGRYFAAWE